MKTNVCAKQTEIRQQFVDVIGKIMFGTIMTCLLTWGNQELNWFEKLTEAFRVI